MIDSIKEKLIHSKAFKQRIEQEIEEKQKKVNRLSKNLKNSETARMIMQTVAQKTQQELEYQISEIVTLALQSVLEETYEFDIEFVIKRGKTEAIIKFIKDGKKFDPMMDTGGGVVDITSFALRIALWQLSSPRSRNTIILDEPFKHLSINYQEKAGKLLSLLSERLNIQFIIITHISELIESADKVFKVVIKKGVSEVV
jgi:DNA repair exonuclease SbcCD ATPase subunit